MEMFKLSLSIGGKRQEIPFSMADYQAAEDEKISLSEYLERKYPTDERDPGTAFEQCLGVSGLVFSEDPHVGRRAPKISDILTGKAELASAIVRPDGTDRHSASGRFFFPTVLMSILESELRDDRSSYTSAFMEMVALTESISGPRYDQVIIDYSAPKGTRAQPISQLAEPVRLLTITTSQIQRALPTWAVGIEISDQAAAASTLDLVKIALREHGAEERALRLTEDFLGIINGNVDAGEAGVISSAVDISTFDPTITTAGSLTQTAWVKWLMQKWMRRQITHVVGSIESYLAVEARAGRPVKNDEPAVDERLNTLPKLALNMIPAGVKFFPMENFPQDLLVGVDANKAMRRVIQVTAAYQAVEAYVMRRSTAFRVDTSERIESLGYADAFSVITLNGAPASS